MCIGYYDKVKEGKVNWVDFYKKRYLKILPFFAFLVLIDIILSRTASSLIEGFADITLLFGLFPNGITVIGVGWFLGLVFVFYLMFPFFCFLISSKKMAWFSFAISLLLQHFCYSYFHVGKSNIIYCLPYFIAGGLIYLYKDSLAKIKWYMFLPVTILSVALLLLLYKPNDNVYTFLFAAACLLIQGILVPFGNTSLISRVVIFISGISMEIYLSHMVIFRAIEKLKLNKLIGFDVLQFVLTAIMVFVGAIIFSYIVQTLINKIVSKCGVK